jgi:uncharacterized protein
LKTQLSKTFLLLLSGLGIWTAPGNAALPPRPAGGEFFHDLADLVDDSSAEIIRDLQQEVFSQAGVPIVVVTIQRMNKYVPGTPGIEGFARQWFDTWGIGSERKNDGILVLVSAKDRKARIELGTDWGRRFDSFCKRLMDQKMVPEFKKGDYGAGLRAAVASLAEVANAGPRADPPEAGLADRILEHPIMVFNREHNPIRDKAGPGVVALMVVVGGCCLFAGIFLPAYRKPLLIAGAVLIALALLFWIFVFVLFILGGGRGGGGGGFGGGSSGGGGASGGW